MVEKTSNNTLNRVRSNATTWQVMPSNFRLKPRGQATRTSGQSPIAGQAKASVAKADNKVGTWNLRPRALARSVQNLLRNSGTTSTPPPSDLPPAPTFPFPGEAKNRPRSNNRPLPPTPQARSSTPGAAADLDAMFAELERQPARPKIGDDELEKKMAELEAGLDQLSAVKTAAPSPRPLPAVPTASTPPLSDLPPLRPLPAVPTA